VSGRALRELPGGVSEESPLALDKLIHERLRLGIVSALAVNEALTFVELKGLLQTTDGNLSVHARRLEEAGYVSTVKDFEGRPPPHGISPDTRRPARARPVSRSDGSVDQGNARGSARAALIHPDNQAIRAIRRRSR
jgi:DNA-binding transcriptional ArsR family regulator